MTNQHELTATYLGGPTILLEWEGLRLLTDPTFDPAGQSYELGAYTLRKTMGPARTIESIGKVDVVLLSHDHHRDNLDDAGRQMLPMAGTVVTTPSGASRLGSGAVGLEPWETMDIPGPSGGVMRVTGTPARHGPAGGDRGPVTGFVLSIAGGQRNAVYISGDTVWYDGVAEIGQRFPIGVAVLFMGAARVREVGPSNLTFTAAEAVEAARALEAATIVPVHFEGWAHFSESREDIASAFEQAKLSQRLRWLRAGQPTRIA